MRWMAPFASSADAGRARGPDRGNGGGQPSAYMLECRKVTKRFGSFIAIDGVSLEVRHGEVVCIVGASGSGKSTLLRLVNGLERLNEGEIVVDGIRLPGKRRDVENIRREVGMVFQSFNLFPHLTIRNNLTLAPMSARGMSRAVAEEKALQLLERVGIADQIDKYPEQLSGGQQQRVAIARALAMDPKMMMFDEPTSALDPEMIHEVLEVMRELARSGMTMLIVTHEMGFAREVAHRVIYFDKGRILVDSPPDEFFTRPKDPRQQEFLSKILHH